VRRRRSIKRLPSLPGRIYGSEVKGPEDCDNHYFDSFGEFVAAVEGVFACPGPRFSGKDRQFDVNPQFYGAARDWPALRSFLENGWAEGAAEIESLRASVDHIVDKVKERSEAMVYDVSGQWLDISRHLDGEPECFGSYMQVEHGGGKGKVVRVDVNVCCSGAVRVEDFRRRGAAVAAFIDLVEASGRRCEVHVVSASYLDYGSRPGDKPANQIRIKAKAANEPLDLSRLAVLIADPGVFRRLILSLMENDGHNGCKCVPAPYLGELLPPELADYASDDDAIMFSQLHLSQIQSFGGFENFLASSLSRMGIGVDGLFEPAE